MSIRYRAQLAITLATLGLGFPACAQEALTLSQALDKAHLHSPAARSAQASLQGADAGVTLAGMRPNPTLSIEAENVMGTGRYAGFGGAERTVSLSVPLELGGKRDARITQARAERSIAVIGAAEARAEIAFRVTEAFVAAVAAEQRFGAARTGRALADQALHAAQERVRVGKASPIEAQRAQVVSINAGVKEGKAERGLALALADLERLVGESVRTPLASSWFGDTERNASKYSREPLSVQRSRAQLDAAAAKVNSARRERLPDLTVTAGTRRYGDSPDKAAVIGLSLPLPLFNTGSSAVAVSQAERERARAELDAGILVSEQELAHADADLADARAAAKAANGPVLAAAEEAARIARIGYTEGKFPQSELIEALRALAETREVAVDSLAALHMANARLARLQGQPDSIYKD